MGYEKSTNERWTRGETALLRKACETQRAAGKEPDPAFWQKLIADGVFPGRSWRALQRRAWARKLYRPRYTKLPLARRPRAPKPAPVATVQVNGTAIPQQGTLPLADPLPRVVAGMLAVETTAPDGTVGPIAVPTGGLVIGTDTTNGRAMLRTASGQAIPTTHTFDQVIRAMARAEGGR